MLPESQLLNETQFHNNTKFYGTVEIHRHTTGTDILQKMNHPYTQTVTRRQW